MAIHSESDSVRDESSSGVRSKAEDENTEGNRNSVTRGGGPGQLGATPSHLSLSTTSTLSSASTTSQARLVQSSQRDSAPPPPPRGSSCGAGNGAESAACISDLGKGALGGSKTTCMQCYLSGHEEGSIDSVDASTEGSSSMDPPSSGQTGPARPRDRDSGIMDDKFDRFVDSVSPSEMTPASKDYEEPNTFDI